MYSSAPGTSFQFFPAGVKILTDFQGEGKIWRKKTIFVCKNTKITIFLNQEGANIPPLPPPPNDVPAPHTYLLTQCTFWHTPQYEARKTTTDRGHNNVLILQYYTIIIKNLKYIFYIPSFFFACLTLKFTRILYYYVYHETILTEVFRVSHCGGVPTGTVCEQVRTCAEEYIMCWILLTYWVNQRGLRSLSIQIKWWLFNIEYYRSLPYYDYATYVCTGYSMNMGRYRIN